MILSSQQFGLIHSLGMHILLSGPIRRTSSASESVARRGWGPDGADPHFAPGSAIQAVETGGFDMTRVISEVDVWKPFMPESS